MPEPRQRRAEQAVELSRSQFAPLRRIERWHWVLSTGAIAGLWQDVRT